MFLFREIVFLRRQIRCVAAREATGAAVDAAAVAATDAATSSAASAVASSA